MTKRIVTPSDGCAWITGASSGIGRDVVYGLAKEGWTVAATARNEAALNELSDAAAKLEGSVHAFAADISNRDGIAAAVGNIEETCGPISLAILSAGIYKAVDAAELNAAVFDQVIDINLKGTVYCLEALIPRLLERRQGHVAIVSSVTGYGGLPTSAAYGATKAALNNLAETLEIELEPYGLRFSVVNPGFVDTPMQRDLEFPKPFMVSSETAAKRIVDGLKKNKFEIAFPKPFICILKFINNFLPKDTYIKLIRRRTVRDGRRGRSQ